VQVATGGAEALAKLESGQWQMLFLDRRLPDLDAEELVEIIERRYPGIRVVMVDSAPGDGEPQESVASICDGISAIADLDSNPRPEIHRNEDPLPGMIGDSEPMRLVYRLARLVAPRNTTVLISGPTGSGKELVARAIHQLSARAANHFSVLNCAAIPEALVESELFGYARGAFTGAMQTYAGRILAAQGGTLFLDEIGELPLGVQSKLLRFLEQKEVQRLGSTETIRVDVRVVAATNRNLAEAVTQGRFRDDLFYRLSAFPIELAGLSQRSGDISKLAAHSLNELSRGSPLRLDVEAAQALNAYSWPGNVRELQQVLERAAILAEDRSLILAEDLKLGVTKNVFSAERRA
jgi:DNA-binding NtrC family response regulator